MLTAKDIIIPLAQRPVDAADQRIPGLLHELAWFATCDNRFYGVLIEDQVDYDFSWVVLGRDQASGNYRAIDLNCSCRSAADATKQLYKSMLEWFPRSEAELAEALR